jgi:hypothetical protein
MLEMGRRMKKAFESGLGIARQFVMVARVLRLLIQFAKL